MSDHLDVVRDAGIVTCTLRNPPTHTLTAAGVSQIHALLDELEGEPGTRVLVFTGAADDVFIAHYEVGELADASERAGSAAPAAQGDAVRLHPMNELTLRLEAAPYVTVAAINGTTAGGGLELALGCDFRLQADGPYRLGLPETSVGILPGAGGTQRMARLLGTARALDLILHARLLTPAEALELGIVHRLHPKEIFADQVAAFAKDLAARAPVALREAKRAIQQGAGLPLRDGLALEQEAFGRTMATQDAARAMRAYLEGRVPEPFTGE